MSWEEALDCPEWGPWLLSVGGPGVIRPGVRLDPFGTSWRVLSTQARRWLPLIESGDPIPGSKRRRDQALSDLRAANLVTESSTLTELGSLALKRWKPLSDAWEYELPLAVALLQEAAAIGDAGFCEMLAFWWDVRNACDDDVLLQDGEAVLLLPYLNRTVDGFNPWIALREAGGPIGLPIPWDQLRECVTNRTEQTDQALTRIKQVLDPSRRLKPRVVFCRGMSLLFVRREQPGGVPPYLDTLALPVRSER
jgi:hypothetical protein